MTKTNRLLKMVVVTKKEVAQRQAKRLREDGCKNVSYRKTKDTDKPYHFYGTAPSNVHRRYYTSCTCDKCKE
jgi:hypothetical protein